jgi:hypothetical protein
MKLSRSNFFINSFLTILYFNMVHILIEKVKKNNKIQLYPFGYVKNASHFSKCFPFFTSHPTTSQITVHCTMILCSQGLGIPTSQFALASNAVLDFIYHAPFKVLFAEVKPPLELLIFIWLLMTFLCLRHSMLRLFFHLLCCHIRCI